MYPCMRRRRRSDHDEFTALLSSVIGGQCRSIIAAGVGPSFNTACKEDAAALLQLLETARTVTCLPELDARAVMRRDMDTIRMKYEHSINEGHETLARSREVTTLQLIVNSSFILLTMCLRAFACAQRPALPLACHTG